MWQKYYVASSLNDALNMLSELGSQARIIAGGTDLMLDFERGVHNEIETLIDITKIEGYNQISLGSDGKIHIGPLVTHNDCLASNLIHGFAFPLAQACWLVGSPQIRNMGTIAGNLITASPANDTITPLMALGAEVTLKSINDQRVVPLKSFFKSVRKTIMQPDELLVDIAFSPITDCQKGTFVKNALRRAQAISVINIAIILAFDGEIIKNATMTLGAVAPTIIHAENAQNYLVGKQLDDQTIQNASELTSAAASPIDDIRSSALYRKAVIKSLTARALSSLRDDNRLIESPPKNPVLLRTQNTIAQPIEAYQGNLPLEITINGQKKTFSSGEKKSLLHLIREDFGLTGTKEGCGEGECGACTIWLNGMAVMSCLIPAPRAHKAEITTIEGLANNGHFHPLQEAFIKEGAVQCGFCTPGFLMSSAKLLQEKQQPDREDIVQSITGNLCRCTGYYKIIKAIERVIIENENN